MRILVNFVNRDGWSVHCLAPDCKTLISQCVMVRTEETLLRLLKALSGRDGRDRARHKAMGSGQHVHAFIDINETGRKLLRILPQQ